MSLELIERLDVASDAAVLDVGGGASSLVDHLMERGFTDVSVLDVSEAALELGRRRVGAGVKWLHEAADRERYLSSLKAGLEPGGGLIMATFAEDGPEYCSGVPVARYAAIELLDLIGPGFRVIEIRRELHVTPGGVTQPFTWVAARAAASGAGGS